MEIHDLETQFKNNPLVLPDDQNFFVIVGANNSGKSTLLRTLVKDFGKESSYLVNVNRTVLTGEGSIKKEYQTDYPNKVNRVMVREDDNYQRETEPLQDFFSLKDVDREPILAWYNQYFPNQIIEEREDVENTASAMLLKVNGFPITKQGSGIRATLEIFIKLFDPKIKILCIDEPEIGLEPYLQKYLFTALKNKASADKKIVLATHSHHFLDVEEVDSNYICQRDSANKIFLEKVTDLKSVIFRLLGNTLAGFLLPEKILVLEGPSDNTFLNRCLSLLSKKDYGVHNSGGNGNLKYAINSVTQFLNFNKTTLPVYKDNVYVIADKPTKDTIIREWKTVLGDNTKLKVLTEDAIEYYYPERILQSIFNTADSRKTIAQSYLRSNSNSYNGVRLSKTDLVKAINEQLNTSDLDDAINELFVFLKNLP